MGDVVVYTKDRGVRVKAWERTLEGKQEVRLARGVDGRAKDKAQQIAELQL